MRYLPTTLCFLLLVVWQTTWRSAAAPAAVKTAPHSIPLHFVSELKGGPVVPAIALQANFLAYPGSPSPKQFLGAPANSPEGVVARYIQVLSDGKSTLTPQTLNAAKSFYAPDERKERNAVIEKAISSDHTDLRPDLFLWHRYDAGPLIMISLAYKSRYGPILMQLSNLRKIGGSYFLSTYNSIYSTEKDDIWPMFSRSEYNLATRPNLAAVPQPAYAYGFPLRTSVPGDTATHNPLKIVFTGTLSDVLVDEKMVPADATQAFIKRAILIDRHSNLQQFLSLWTDYDVKNFFKDAAKDDPHHIPGSSLDVADGDQTRIVFTIDCGVESLVFLRTGNIKNLSWLVVWKQAPNDYRLSESYKLETGEETLPDKMREIFLSSAFQDYLNAQVDQFIKEQDAKKGAERTSAPGNK